MAPVAGARNYDEVMASDRTATNGACGAIRGSSHMTGCTSDSGSFVLFVESVPGAFLMAAGAQGAGGHSGTRLLGVHFVAGHASNAGLTVSTCLPLGQGAAMTGAA